MKKEFLLTTFMLVLFQLVYAQDTEQMVFKNDFREASGGLGNLTAMFMTDSWCVDANGDEAAIIRITVVDMSVSEMKKLEVKGSPNLGYRNKECLEKEHQIVISVSASNNMYLEMTHNAYGTSTRLNITERLKPKTIYDVTLINNKTTTIVVRSIPEGAYVFLNGDKKGQTPCEIPGQRFGSHKLKLLYGGSSLVQDIEVEEGHTVFDKFDFRERAKVKITSDPDGAAIYVDDIMIGKAPVQDYNVVLGAHTFKAVLNAEQTDEQSINITKYTTTIDLHPVKKSNVLITTKYSGRPVSASLVVDNEKNYTGKEAYNVTLPYGQHNFRVSYGGRTKEKALRLSKPEVSHTFKLSAKNDFVWPWQREYEQHPFGFSMGYVTKQIVAKNGPNRYKMDPAYFREGKSLSGMQMGIHLQPTLSWGGGFYTGLFYELYMANCDDYGEAAQYFTEHSLNLPIHLYYRIAFSEKFSIAIHGGIGLDMGLYASYSEGFLGSTDSDSGYSEAYDDYYGEDNGGPNAFNMTWDIAGSINFRRIALNIFMAKGLLNHKGVGEWDDGEGKNAINKFGITLSYLFGNN